MRVVRHPDAARKKLADWLEGFHGCARLMREHPLPVFKSFALVLLQRVLYLLIPWCVYVALGLHGASVWQLMGLQLLLSTSVEMLPLPGAVGASESGFLVLYNAVFGAQALYPAVMLSRGISYYLPLLVSAGVVVFTRLSYLRAHRRIPSA